MTNGLIDQQIVVSVIAEGVPYSTYLTAGYEGRTEWIAGRVVRYMPNNITHQRILGWLHQVIGLFLAFNPIGVVLTAGVSMYVGEDRPAREPDLLVILNAHRGRLQHTYLDGPADLAVEIISPESERRDRADKFLEYEAAGVQEYWLIDPLRQQAMLYALNADGRYLQQPPDAHNRLISHVLPGFRLPVALLWQEQPLSGQELVDLVQGMVNESSSP